MLEFTGGSTILLYGYALKALWLAFIFYILMIFINWFKEYNAIERDYSQIDQYPPIPYKKLIVCALIASVASTASVYKPRLVITDSAQEKRASDERVAEAESFVQVPIAPASTNPASDSTVVVEDIVTDAAAKRKQAILDAAKANQ